MEKQHSQRKHVNCKHVDLERQLDSCPFCLWTKKGSLDIDTPTMVLALKMVPSVWPVFFGILHSNSHRFWRRLSLNLDLPYRMTPFFGGSVTSCNTPVGYIVPAEICFDRNQALVVASPSCG